MSTAPKTGFADVFRPESMACNLQVRTRDEALAELIRLLEKDTPGLDPQIMLRDLVAREELAPTVVHPGIAVPHLRLDGVSRLLLAVGTSVPGIAFNGDPDHLVHAVFLILTPRNDPDAYLQVLADLLRKERDMKLADFMREEYVKVAADVPAIQLAKIFLMDKTRQILVMEDRHLLGVVNLRSFISKLFWA